MPNHEGFAESIRERVAVLIDDIDDLADFLDENALMLAKGDDLTIEQSRALGWLEGAAEASGMTVIEFGRRQHLTRGEHGFPRGL